MYYPLALVQYILRDVDPHVRLGLLYDIGCNFEAHLVKRNLLSQERAEKRLKIGVAVFHAYAHNWLCQMRYNPRITTGFALTDGEDTERNWSSLSPLVRLNREASRSLRLNNIDHLTKFINENKLLELVGFIKNRFVKTKKILSDAENDLLRVQSDGNICEEELRAEWEKQKKAQSAEGEIEAAAERSRKYERLGELIFLWDRVKPLLEALKDAVKTNDTSVMRDAQIVLNSLAEKQSLHGPNISQEALGLTRKGFSEEEVKNLCRIHAAKCVLRREYDKHKATMRPMQEAQEGLRPPLGQLAVQKLHRNLKSQDKKRNLAVLNYQQAVQIYLASDRPKVAVQTVANWKELKDKREDDIFWMDVIFGAENGALWANNSYYLNGIDALRRRDCCNEELELLTAETARLIRWSQNHSDKITKALAEWETAKEGWLTYEAQLGTSQMTRGQESAEAPMKPDLGSNVQECLSIIHILRRHQYEHFHLEERWVADGLYSLCSVHIQPSALGAPLETVVKDIYTRVWDARDDESAAVNDGRSISTSLYQQKDLSRDISSTILALERREETPEGERDDWNGVRTAEEDPENEEGWVDEE
ncbi:hypothetical protein J003_06750 [Cryptococcus neoformans]|nr:hypothetical protein C350_06722 [Cryptococcus neoformans var. grubii MW-RSA36]OXH42605.1 hypothetical protein J003_06750 [Cryptococcus neoformans var. grubii]OXH43877.1 hypothetical protein J002_06752 [Cryptococcus neoformans var. grubii]OXL08485.1 hypothetical protein C348_03212 [Cryptococcus neoformans var. grubii Gb118]OXL10272.1 hypothetical protein C348_01561 [Cryptococcus neoformans var. grubii Gb118]